MFKGTGLGKFGEGPTGVIRGVVFCSVLLGLSGCKMFVKEEPPPCPRVSILAEADKLVRFRPGPGRDDPDIEFEAKVVSYKGSCLYDRDEKSMTVDLQVGIEVIRGPALAAGKRELSYFVAVPTFFPFPGAKKVLPLSLDFDKDTTHLKLTDRDVKLTFPVKSVKELERYEVFIGMQLSEAELNYVKHHPSH